jgi:hypothetical protein
MSETLFDQRGRLLPTQSERVYDRVNRGYFSLEQPSINFNEIYARLSKHLNNTSIEISATEFEAIASRLWNKITSESYGENLTNAVHVPFIVPKIKSIKEPFRNLEDWIPALHASYAEAYPNFEFKNLVTAVQTQELKISKFSRYESLVERASQRDLVGWYFPNVMSGYAVPDHRTLMERLPDEFVLSGPLETTTSLIGTPSLLMKNDGKYPNLLCLSSVEPDKDNEKHFFYFYEAYGWNLNFNRRSMIGAVSEYYAGGLTILSDS